MVACREKGSSAWRCCLELCRCITANAVEVPAPLVLPARILTAELNGIHVALVNKACSSFHDSCSRVLWNQRWFWTVDHGPGLPRWHHQIVESLGWL